MALTKVTEGVRTLGTGEVVDANIATDTISIGKISGSAAASADTFLKKDGTWSAVASGIEWQAVQTTGFTAVAGKGYPCNTTASAFTVTLPASASVGDQISIVDYAGTFATNNITLGNNGLKIKGDAGNKTLKTDRLGLKLVYVDATQGWVTATSSTAEAIAPSSYSVDWMCVAGGGGGAYSMSGGGGGGGLRNSYNSEPSGGGGPTETPLNLIPSTVYTIAVGAGGPGALTRVVGTNGYDSSISGSGLTTITSVGGGGGGPYIGVPASGLAGVSGGSGGGGGSAESGGTGGAGGSGTAQQGYDGGVAWVVANYGSGGGGGAGAGGANGTSTVGGNGGIGVQLTIDGNSHYWAGGGGGGCYDGGPQGGNGGNGGGAAGSSGGGSAATGGAGLNAGGSTTGSLAPGAIGGANTGGGGGGGAHNTYAGGNGGSGVVHLRILTTNYTGLTSGTPTVIVSGSHTILRYTGTGTYTA